MLAEILKTNPVDHLGFKVNLQQLSVALDKISFNGVVNTEQHFKSPGLSLVLSSGSRIWTFECDRHEDHLIFEGDLPTKDLAVDVSFTFCFNNIRRISSACSYRYSWSVGYINFNACCSSNI